MFIRGDFDSQSSRLLSLRLNRCVETDTLTCRTEEEITQFFRNKLLLILYNQKRFDSSQFEYESFVNEARFNWMYVNTQVREQIPFKVTKTNIRL